MKLNENVLKIIKSVKTGCLLLLTSIIFYVQNVHAQEEIPLPPAGYAQYKSDIPHGTTEIVSYYSSTVGIERKTRIYLPPDYTTDSIYNVLYLLHGIGGNINEWWNGGTPNIILDNLYAKNRIAPMIVVLPNGRAMEDDSPGSDIYAADKQEGFANFEFELLKDLIPFIDTNYSVKPGRKARAIAGLSMGGGQALNFGLAHLDTFAWVGAFSPAPNTKAAADLIPTLEDTSLLSGLWISCGDADGLFFIAENTHNYLQQNNIRHYFWIQEGKGHDFSVWKPGLYHFSQRIFGNTYSPDTISTTGNTNPNTGFNESHKKKQTDFVYNSLDETIHVTSSTHNGLVNIYDLNGKLQVSELLLSDNVVNIGKLSNGIYLISMSDGRTYWQHKIVKTD